jgi:hypothetical protein
MVPVRSRVTRNAKGTSKKLADKLAEIADPENKIPVKIRVDSNLDRVGGILFRLKR